MGITFLRRQTAVLGAATAWLLIAGPAAAQDHPRVELSGIGGYRVGSLHEFSTGIFCIALFGAPCPSVAEGEAGPVLGGVVDVAVTPTLALEIVATHHFSRLQYVNFGADPRSQIDDGQDLDLTTMQGGLMYRWRGQRVSPFVAGGIGVTWIRTDDGPVTRDDAALSLGGSVGVLVHLVPRVAVRLEARPSWVNAPDRSGGPFAHLDLMSGLTVAW